MAGLVPAIQTATVGIGRRFFAASVVAWMAGSSPAMTRNVIFSNPHSLYAGRDGVFSPPNRLTKKSMKLRSFGATWRRLT